MSDEFLKGTPLTEERKKKRVMEEIERLTRIKRELEGNQNYRGSHQELKKLTHTRWAGYYNNVKGKTVDAESDVKKAHRLIILEGMGVDPRFSEIVEDTGNKLLFRSRNFCPILEACKILGLDTKIVCKSIYEKPVQDICRFINPQLKFGRNYKKIRPYHEYCEEWIDLSE